MYDIDNSLLRLSKSKFRSSFHLKAKDIQYIQTKGLDTIERHAYDFITSRLAPAVIPNDGKQTPMKGHPVFIAQHACACCCRDCLNKWYQIEKSRELTNEEITFIVQLMMAWITNEYQSQI